MMSICPRHSVIRILVDCGCGIEPLDPIGLTFSVVRPAAWSLSRDNRRPMRCHNHPVAPLLLFESSVVVAGYCVWVPRPTTYRVTPTSPRLCPADQRPWVPERLAFLCQYTQVPGAATRNTGRTSTEEAVCPGSSSSPQAASSGNGDRFSPLRKCGLSALGGVSPQPQSTGIRMTEGLRTNGHHDEGAGMFTINDKPRLCPGTPTGGSKPVSSHWAGDPGRPSSQG
jgi:hypothetical protein